LLRWTSPEHGPVSPAEFIPLAEETGLIVPIGAWVLHAACQQMARWRDAGQREIALAVNLSPHQLRAAGLVDSVRALLADHALRPGTLELEITETALLDDSERTRVLLHELRELGVRLAIDDFGTGYSALGYLKRVKADVLKIDRSFVQDLADEPAETAMVAAIIALAAGLGLRTVAEGVETVAQLRRLRALGCDEMQGYLFSPAVGADEFVELIAQRRELPATSPSDDVRRTRALVDHSKDGLASLISRKPDIKRRRSRVADPESA
jgi:EAL domain-containing protein (putative c-di-GMP-specific phosphodiesterase class I)